MMVTMYINRAGRNLKPERRAALERAKRMLQAKLKTQKGRGK
jgi:Protein of unknown function (DUF3175)